MTLSKVSQKDIDDLVTLADNDPEFKEILRSMDELARVRKCELADVIQTAVNWYRKQYPGLIEKKMEMANKDEV